MSRFVPFVFERFKPKPVPRWKDGSTEGIWEPVEKILDELERQRPQIAEVDGEKGIWVYSHEKRRKVFIPLDKVDWSRIPVKHITAGLLTAVIFTTVGSPRFRAFLRGMVFKPELGMGRKLLGRQALRFITKNPQAVERAFIAARTPDFGLKNFGFFKWKEFEGFLVEGRVGRVKDSSLTLVFGPKGKTLYIVDAYVPSETPRGNERLFKLMFGTILRTEPEKLIVNTGQGEGARMWARLGADWANDQVRDIHKRTLKKLVRSSKAITDEWAENMALKAIDSAKSPKEVLSGLVTFLGRPLGESIFGRVSWQGVLKYKDLKPLLENLIHKL
ncbi:hypothetical protein DRO31_02935 [Candidatus Bathyarchaeota archaeon]|nr:MAG: hypothetical protein DRO31_02935 [Candidatus Bathyarchaeota archaeon]